MCLACIIGYQPLWQNHKIDTVTCISTDNISNSNLFLLHSQAMQSITNILRTNSINTLAITRQGEKNMSCQSLCYDKQIYSYSETNYIPEV